MTEQNQSERIKQIRTKSGTVYRKTKTRSGDMRYYKKPDGEDTFKRVNYQSWGGAHKQDYLVESDESSVNNSGRRIPKDLDQAFDGETLGTATENVRSRTENDETTRTIKATDTAKTRSIKGIQQKKEFENAVDEMFGHLKGEDKEIAKEALAQQITEEAGNARREGAEESEIIDRINGQLPQGIEFHS